MNFSKSLQYHKLQLVNHWSVLWAILNDYSWFTLLFLMALNVFWQPLLAQTQECSGSDYKIFKKYDAYLDANPTVDDEQLRAKFAKRLGIPPISLRSLYFRCLPEWVRREPEAAEKSILDLAGRMAAVGESPFTIGQSCHTLGYRYGHTTTRTMLSKQANIGWDFEMPERCRNKQATIHGIKAGAKAAAK